MRKKRVKLNVDELWEYCKADFLARLHLEMSEEHFRFEYSRLFILMHMGAMCRKIGGPELAQRTAAWKAELEVAVRARAPQDHPDERVSPLILAQLREEP